MKSEKSITLPHDWTPRPYQVELFSALDRGIKRAVIVWHRRSGKDSCCFNYLVKAAHRRVGNYWHLYPTAKQGRKALWAAIDKQGRRVIDQAAPKVLRQSDRDDEMLIKFKNGSTIQVMGADSDSLVGSNPVGVVFSEYAITSPSVWHYVSPILAENDGFAIFNSTPRGHNHLYELYESNKNNPDWFTSIKNWRETGAITQSVIDADIRAGMPLEVAEQEYNCSFTAPNVGLVYGRQLILAEKQGRVGSVPYNGAHPVETWWDIGHRDATAIWFIQRLEGHINVVDYYEARNQGLPHFAQKIYQKPYSYIRHVGPHDLDNKVWALDGTTKQIAANHGIAFTVAPKLPIKDGIDATRAMLSLCRFDASRTADGLRALKAYEFEWDEDKKIFGDRPVHNWASHGADAFRYGAVTPAEFGVIPLWARSMLPAGQMQGQKFGNRMMGHNGGPSLDDTPAYADDFDPLGYFRGARA